MEFYFCISLLKVIISFPSSSRLNNRFHWLLRSVLHSVFVSDRACGSKTTKITPDRCALLLVTKYECVSLRPAWDPQPWLPISLAGRTKNGWDSTHSWSRCHFKPKPGYTVLYWPSSLLPPATGELQPCEQGGAEQNRLCCCHRVSINPKLLTLWDRVNGTLCAGWVSSFSPGLWSVCWFLRLSSTCMYALSCEWKEGFLLAHISK